MLKQLLASSPVQFLIGRTMGLYMLFVGVTTRWTRINQAAAEPFWSGRGRIILCVWHNRFTLAHKLWRFGPGATKALFLVSRSREGGIAAHAAQTVGTDVIRGSSAKPGKRGKGGTEAGLEAVRHLDNNGCVGFTPDGPRGPRMRAKLGPVQIARMGQAPMLCLAWSTSHCRVFDSWDRFILPLPFGRGALIWSDPIAPPAPDASDAEMEAVRLKLETEMNRIAAEADRFAGIAVIEPAPLRAEAPRDAEPAEAS